jgi:Neprosin
MFVNPNPGPDGKHPPRQKPPPLNPEIAKYFEARQAQLKPLRTTKTAAGQVLDWVPIESQLRAREKIANPPPPRRARSDSRIGAIEFELLSPGAERGPPGTVPILRKNLAALHDTRSLAEHLAKRGGANANSHRPKTPLPPNSGTFYHCTSGQTINCLGCEAWFNVWQPYVELSNDHSIMQLTLQNYDRPQLQSLEAGWSCDHSLNGDWSPHLFTYYTTNGYTNDGDNLGGYNNDVAGWVQVSGNIYPGIGLSPVSALGGTQYGLAIGYAVVDNNWWFWVQTTASGLGEWIGYYPSWLFFGAPGESLFSTLGANAEWVAFWGEVGTARSDPQNTRTQMGSGQKAEAGWTKACFQKNLNVVLRPDSDLVNQNGNPYADLPNKYDIQAFMNSGSDWASYFYAGGD